MSSDTLVCSLVRELTETILYAHDSETTFSDDALEVLIHAARKYTQELLDDMSKAQMEYRLLSSAS